MSEELGPEPQDLQDQVMDSLAEVREDFAKEKAQEQQNRQWFNLIGLSTGILSGLAAVAAMQSGSLANEAMLTQIHATDQWAFYQAKSTKRHLDESTVIVLQSLQKPIPPQLSGEIGKLRKEQNGIQAEAQKLQAESQQDLSRHELLARSVTALQVGISLGAVAALLRRRSIWYLGLGIAAIGICFIIAGAIPGEQPQRQVQPVSSDS